ncbi:DUF2280 domain-containing protein [Dongia sedimenti]|uniref:DUF2280 domain-containing protein n=1 Tax=Dongia sedimenti TaxID=3064282 RepID=A0ABU0YIH4_9PROT|nr:DUF2280 domain-containing protein [Rhodospirillaceae bacterium R-7]
MTLTQTAHRQTVSAAPFSTDRLRSFIETRLARREPEERIAAAVRAYFEIAIDAAEVVPFWKGEITLPTQTERRQDKESTQFPEDEVQAPRFTVMADPLSDTAAAPAPFSITPDPGPICDAAQAADADATQTAHRQDADFQDADSLQIPVDVRDDPDAARHAALEALGEQVKARLGIAPDPKPATQTGRRQKQKRSVLTDEVKVFIVKGLARYETPSRVAASVLAEFGIAIDRRQVFAYDPAGSRPPAQRWIDLHAAARAKFLRALSEIGVAQKVVRLRMLDRLANRADEANQTERVAKLLEQAAKECGGFYERYARPKIAAPVAPTR